MVNIIQVLAATAVMTTSASSFSISDRNPIANLSSPEATRNATVAARATLARRDKFMSSCNRPRISEGKDSQRDFAWLDAFCHSEDGRLWHSVINLNLCLANDLGSMTVRSNGGFAASCWGIYMDADYNLHATCGNARGGQTTPSVNLNAFVGNQNGELTCLGHFGCAWNTLGCNDKPNGVNGR